MRRKSIWIIIASLIVIAGCGFFIFNRQQKQNTAQTKSNDNAGLVVSKKKKSNVGPSSTNSNNDSSENYSTDQWMLMGYMAYAHDNYVESRHIQNTKDLVDDVDEDLGDGALKAEKTGNTTYHLTNKFGSVDVEVEDDDVKVTGDGSTYTSKSELTNTFKPYAAQILTMTKKISTGSSDDSSNETSSDAQFNTYELVTAAYLDGFDGSTPQGKIATANKILAKDQRPAKQVPTDEYLNGFYKNDGYISIASNLSTSRFAEFKIDDSDRIVKKYGGGGVLQTKYLSKKKILQTWTPYKNDVDRIMIQIRKNKDRSEEIQKAIGLR